MKLTGIWWVEVITTDVRFQLSVWSCIINWLRCCSITKELTLLTPAGWKLYTVHSSIVLKKSTLRELFHVNYSQNLFSDLFIFLFNFFFTLLVWDSVEVTGSEVGVRVRERDVGSGKVLEPRFTLRMPLAQYVGALATRLLAQTKLTLKKKVLY